MRTESQKKYWSEVAQEILSRQGGAQTEKMPKPDNAWGPFCEKVLALYGKEEPLPYIQKILLDGPSSIAFIPEENPGLVIKAVKKDRVPEGYMIREEFTLAQDLHLNMKGERYRTPIPVSFGSHPPYLAMYHLGTSFISHLDDSFIAPSAIEKIGGALGEFAARLYAKHGAIHGDLTPNNYTETPDGKIGIIDIASIKKTIQPEEMFLRPLLCPHNICPSMAEKYDAVIDEINKSRSDGDKIPHINFDLVKKISLERVPSYLKEAESNPFIKRAKERVEKQNVHLEDWEKRRKEKVEISENAPPDRPKQPIPSDKKPLPKTL